MHNVQYMTLQTLTSKITQSGGTQYIIPQYLGSPDAGSNVTINEQDSFMI